MIDGQLGMQRTCFFDQILDYFLNGHHFQLVQLFILPLKLWQVAPWTQMTINYFQQLVATGWWRTSISTCNVSSLFSH